MAEWLLSKAAEDDLLNLFRDGADRFGIDAAARYRDGIKRSLTLLASHPQSGRARPDLALKVRSRAYRSHIIFYVADGAGVLVVRVLHAAMNAPDHLDEPDDLADWRDFPNEGDTDLDW